MRRASGFNGPGSIPTRSIHFWLFAILFFKTFTLRCAQKQSPFTAGSAIFFSFSSYRFTAGALFAAGALLAETGLCGMGVPPTQSGRNYGKGEPTRDEGSFRSTTVKPNLAITGEEIEVSHFSLR